MSSARRSGYSIWKAASMAAAALGLAMLAGSVALAQNPQLQERVAEIRQASAQNKQLLAQYLPAFEDGFGITAGAKPDCAPGLDFPA